MSYFGGPPGSGRGHHHRNGGNNNVNDSRSNNGRSGEFYDSDHYAGNNYNGGGNVNPYNNGPDHPHSAAMGMGMNRLLNGIDIPGMESPYASQMVGMATAPYMQQHQPMIPSGYGQMGHMGQMSQQMYHPNPRQLPYQMHQPSSQNQQQRIPQTQSQPQPQMRQPPPQQPKQHHHHQPAHSTSKAMQRISPPHMMQAQPRQSEGGINNFDMATESRNGSKMEKPEEAPHVPPSDAAEGPQEDIVKAPREKEPPILPASAAHDSKSNEALSPSDPQTSLPALGNSSATAASADSDARMENKVETGGNEPIFNQNKEHKNLSDESSEQQRQDELHQEKKRRLDGTPASVVETCQDDEVDAPFVTDDDDLNDGKTKQNIAMNESQSLDFKSSSKILSSGGTTVSTAETAPESKKWYEGVLSPMALPEDKTHLSELQQFIRINMELFSANEWDARMSQAGRRQPIVRGKVGVRCIHCSRAFASIRAEEDRNGVTNSSSSYKYYWPPGSVSYPANIAAIYSVCSQKPQQHFDSCPNLPENAKEKLKELHKPSAAATVEPKSGNDGEIVSSTPSSRKRSRNENGISAPMYYAICAKRQGIIEVHEQGLKFGRDLSLAPLPFATMKPEVERGMVSSMAIPQSVVTSSPKPVNGPIKRAPVDPESEKCLASALDINPDSKVQLLIHPDDRNLLTDFIFLATAQMALCRASRLDFRTRGKKTKAMRIGLAGFCCRFCCEKHDNFNLDTVSLEAVSSSCRSFSSMPDNLASAISNSFVAHLLKCPNVPQSIKHALDVFRPMHSAQMQQLIFGSQRRLYMELWNRMRAEDRIPPDGGIPDDLDDDGLDRKWSPKPASKKAGPGKRTPVAKSLESLPIETTIDHDRKNARVGAYPICAEERIINILERFNTNWNDDDFKYDEDRLMTPEWKPLVSDYVFLMMRQLKIAMPQPEDFRGNRRSTVIGRMAGMCCIYCNSKKDDEGPPVQASIPTGRSFPSAADNMASTLNSSLYNHMQSCRFVPSELKTAFVQLRKIHSAQCAALKFGSQRRFFNIIFEKLKRIPVDTSKLNLGTPMASVLAQTSTRPRRSRTPTNKSSTREAAPGGTREAPRSSLASIDDRMLSKYSYVRGRSYVQCIRCRMVPFELRTPNSLVFDGMVIHRIHLHYHFKTCMGDGIDLRTAAEALKSIFAPDESDKLSSMVRSDSFQKLISCAVGGHEALINLFGKEMLKLPILESITDAVKSDSIEGTAAGADEPPSAEPISTIGLWRFLPVSVALDDINRAFEAVAKEIELDSTDITNHTNAKFMRFLQVISPWMQLTTDIVEEVKSEPASASEVDQNETDASSDMDRDDSEGNTEEDGSLSPRKIKYKDDIEQSEEDAESDGDNSVESDYDPTEVGVVQLET